jgi:hypothetical protein
LLNLCSSLYQIQDSLVANLLRLIQKMKPKPKAEVKLKKEEEIDNETLKSDIEIKKKLFPGLAIADDPKIRVGGMCLSLSISRYYSPSILSTLSRVRCLLKE